MKANELMIGDWVQDITPVVIDAISNEDICTYRDEHGYITANPSNLKPIPLTAEILEKNGFVNSGGLWHLSGEDMGLMQGCISFQAFAYYADPRYCFCEIAYLHELQHALRLCGITHEISL